MFLESYFSWIVKLGLCRQRIIMTTWKCIFTSQNLFWTQLLKFSTLSTQSQGILHPISGANYGNRRFGFMVSWFTLTYALHMYSIQLVCTSSQVANASSIAIITISLDTNSIISILGTPVSLIQPVTFLYGINTFFSCGVRLCFFFPYPAELEKQEVDTKLLYSMQINHYKWTWTL